MGVLLKVVMALPHGGRQFVGIFTPDFRHPPYPDNPVGDVGCPRLFIMGFMAAF
jgi:hypothetical protein